MTVDAALAVIALAVGGFLFYRAIQSLGQTSVFVIQWGLVIFMVALAMILVLQLGVQPIVTTLMVTASASSSPRQHPSPPPPTVSTTDPLLVHTGRFIRTGLTRAVGWLSSWTSAPGAAFPSADSPSSAEKDRDL